jgi:MoaA/NifB/PqqE/SkfB family radical SAM enzyme
MANLALPRMIRLAKRGIDTYVANRPMVVSYEVTLSCNCNCHHCDLGGLVKDEIQIGPNEYADLTKKLRPLAAQISGGEPLLRKDLAAIVKAIKQSDGLPYVILVTNGVLLNEDNYLRLHEAGVNQFSVSLDFPDERHDRFRRRPGLYKRLEQRLPQLAQFGFQDIILNTAITRANVRDILPLADKAADWNVGISYSAYTALRTGNADYCVNEGEDLEVLRKAIMELVKAKRNGANIVNPEPVLRGTLRFFEQGNMPHCKAGIRFLIIMPDGSLVPCSLHRDKYSDREEMVRGFSRTNRCSDCYVAIRSYSELSLWSHIRSAPMYIRQTLFR